MGKDQKRERAPVKSRAWSCSELVESHKELVAAKLEREDDDELQQKIKVGHSMACSVFAPGI